MSETKPQILSYCEDTAVYTDSDGIVRCNSCGLPEADCRKKPEYFPAAPLNGEEEDDDDNATIHTDDCNCPNGECVAMKQRYKKLKSFEPTKTEEDYRLLAEQSMQIVSQKDAEIAAKDAEVKQLQEKVKKLKDTCKGYQFEEQEMKQRHQKEIEQLNLFLDTKAIETIRIKRKFKDHFCKEPCDIREWQKIPTDCQFMFYVKNEHFDERVPVWSCTKLYSEEGCL